ncbi:MAG: nitrogen fixation protein NifM [Gammaproteobacteria bacterium]|jgi:peptidyl-prolyl cis-trans isomerase C
MSDATPTYRYHLLRGALDRFNRNIAGLDRAQLSEARRQADRTFALESLVLASAEAGKVVIPQEQLDAAFATVLARYSDRAAIDADLHSNGLDGEALRQALRRELVFDAVMQRVGSRRPRVSPLDARIYYELHFDKFVTPEQRSARQLLITVNDAFEENLRAAARARIDNIAAGLRRNPRRFADQARRHSECPSALHGGKLGDIRRGQLFPQLDSALFAMREGQVSDVIETEVGFHLLLCERVTASRVLAFSSVEARITALLDGRNQRNCQKAFIKQLQEVGGAETRHE